MPMLLEGKIILVSGGTRGLGAGIAQAAAADGAAGIMITERDRAAGEALVAELAGNGTDVRFQAVDLADPLAAAGSVTATVASFGRIDCVVNSAGITTRGTLLDTSVELFDAHTAINLRAPFFIMQAAVHDMRSRQTPGSIVNNHLLLRTRRTALSSPVRGCQGGLGGPHSQCCPRPPL